jgi:DDE family transposase
VSTETKEDQTARREGGHNSDCDAQFGYINGKVTAALAGGDPAVSVDTKKKELVGDFKNPGRELRPKANPNRCLCMTSRSRTRTSCAVWDLQYCWQHGLGECRHRSRHSSFAVNAIRRWWQTMGHLRYPGASSLLITAGCSGSNGARVRLWKRELQTLAYELA